MELQTSGHTGLQGEPVPGGDAVCWLGVRDNARVTLAFSR
jgi:hypothetical protein